MDKNFSTMGNVLVNWILGVIGIIINTVLLPINLVLGLLTDQVITINLT